MFIALKRISEVGGSRATFELNVRFTSIVAVESENRKGPDDEELCWIYIGSIRLLVVKTRELADLVA
ncbi:hypothetical protein QTL95_26965 [Rhizobium sp. S152]|uniref:hypothetical protein n=1 Tax=Rhizobium sp. S152 TaxID=3055038 RepID=UPI0025A9C262|nr:hypothetical protein [Rhizobium sp. S152]MDM9629530.1 hypothetical protein [Rhizobium sp. S152]